MTSANIMGMEDTDEAHAIVRRHDTDAGPLWIITGGGPVVGFDTLFANPFFVGLLTLVSFLVR